MTFKPPGWSNRRKRTYHKAATSRGAMGDVEAARSPFPPAPGNDVEIEHPLSPATATATTEVAFNGLEAAEHLGRIQIAFNQCDRIGEVPTGTAVRWVEQDRGSVEQTKFLVETRDGGFNDARRPAVLPVAPVRADRDCIELRCA